MNIFYAPGLEGDRYVLDPGESNHAVRVLRLESGAPLVLVDGKGGWYEATLEGTEKAGCQVRIHSEHPDYKPLPYALHIAVSPTKSSERFEWFLEKATEIGISEITPVLCHRSERSTLNMVRAKRILVSAMKQSKKAFLPRIHDPVPIERFLMKKHSGILGISHCQPGKRSALAELLHSDSYTLMVGPEGDFTGEEIRLAAEHGFKPFNLGNSILRTETAGVYLAAFIHGRHNR